MARNAFTLLELLVVMAIVVAIAGVALPLTVERLTRQRFDEAAVLMEAAVGTARAESQLALRALAIDVTGGDSGDEAAGTEAARQPTPVTLATSHLAADATGPGRRIGEPTELPGGVRLDRSGEPSDGGETGEEPRRVLAVALPTGEILARSPWRLSDGTGRAADVEIGRWTGVVTLRPVVVEPAEPILAGDEP